jgi:hypothetical protein
MKSLSFRALRNTVVNAALLAASIGAAGTSQAQAYQFIDLGGGQANGINDSGIVVGESAADNAE